MITKMLRRAAHVGLALWVGHSVAAPTVPPVAGHYETENARWAKPQDSFAGRGEALHYSPSSHSADQTFMGISFFPEGALQMAQLTQLQIQLELPMGQSCGGGRPAVTIVMQDANSHPKYVYGHVRNYGVDPATCAVGQWSTLDFIADADWNANNVGGSVGTLAAADAAAKGTLGQDYRISVIRIAYEPSVNTEAWFDVAWINGNPMLERINDLSTNALMPDRSTPTPTTFGYFQTRNIRWGAAPGFALHGEAMHFSPYSHGPADPVMSTSFFPQNPLSIADLDSMGFTMYVPSGSSCGAGAPRMVLVLSNAVGTMSRQITIYRNDIPSACNTGVWLNLDFLNDPAVRWDVTPLGGSNNATKVAAHQAAIAALGLNYAIKVVRINADGGAGPELWFDQEKINGALLLERVQDFTSDALLVDAPALPNGVVPYLP